MARSIDFYINNEEVNLTLGDYALILYYASQLNQTLAKKLYEVTVNEYCYQLINGLSVNDFDSDSPLAHFIPADLKAAVGFIKTELLPSIEVESYPILQRYRGKGEFIDEFNSNAGTFRYITLQEEEIFQDEPIDLAFRINLLKNVLQESINVNKPIKVVMRF